MAQPTGCCKSTSCSKARLININDPAAGAVNAFEALFIKVRTASLALVASKSTPHPSDQDMAAAAAAELDVLNTRDDLIITTTPIGTGPFVRALLSRKRQKLRYKIQRLVAAWRRLAAWFWRYRLAAAHGIARERCWRDRITHLFWKVRG
jgi:hypothetical protein